MIRSRLFWANVGAKTYSVVRLSGHPTSTQGALVRIGDRANRTASSFAGKASYLSSVTRILLVNARHDPLCTIDGEYCIVRKYPKFCGQSCLLVVQSDLVVWTRPGER
ncbi:MAG: hypothetical protein JWO19_3379 [Bryobacterales bacterium]|nr:hypothetical protein [Bryobacterales bacterium]